ncbi:superfamily I DNA and RNA helicase and helicaseubunit [Sulfolobus islandicus]|uniref:PaREP1 domain containing protein n=1 Tax=Saccharolobus islandicus (strain HVE10/4) TaxID=930943 RepID=F0NNC4_SACI0|nr:PaREP1 family protein [Sulfolobus islandicus]ADX81882.1 PaREP1 domain containing protein [Sulfolobus islandicus HVE10/4]WCM36766.1 superfamily I DNA and RNA helicase and helicaseubunit [Sulfolobus islandicus]
MEELIKKAEDIGINVEDVLISLISKNDPKEEIKLRLDLAKKYMKECEEHLKKNDPVQASEKAYKVAEELIKALAEKFNLEEYQKTLKEGRWYAYLLVSASSKLSQKLGDWVLSGWDAGYSLHVWGFHEAKLAINDILPRVEKVRKMLEESEKILAN